MGIGKTGAAKIRHGVCLAPDNIVQHPELLVLQNRADAEDIVIAAHHPNRAVGLEDAPRRAHPIMGEQIIGIHRVILVPSFRHAVDMGIIGPREIAAQL